MPQTAVRKHCKKCKKLKRLTEFSYVKKHDGPRKDFCHSCSYDGYTADQRHLILREAYRNYLTFEQFVADTGQDVIEYSVPQEEGGDWVPVRVSFTDLKRALTTFVDGSKADGTVLSKRKEQAFLLNVIKDMKQKDVAEIMNITTVSVGQYVEQACLQISVYYFNEGAPEGTLEKDTDQESN